MKKTKQDNGFTLIELLVVISIISLLASIVLVNVINARAEARDTKRLENLNTLSSSLETFATDKGTYPTGETELPLVFAGASPFNAVDTSSNGKFIPDLANNGYLSKDILDNGDPSTGRGVMYYINLTQTRQYFSNPTTWAYDMGNLFGRYCGGQFTTFPYSPMPQYMLIDYLEKLPVPPDIQCQGLIGQNAACICKY